MFNGIWLGIWERFGCVFFDVNVSVGCQNSLTIVGKVLRLKVTK